MVFIAAIPLGFRIANKKKQGGDLKISRALSGWGPKSSENSTFNACTSEK